MNLQVIARTTTEITRARDPHSPWDADDLRHVTEIHGLVQVGDKAYFDLIHPFSLVEGDRLFLVWATYATGDSSHTENGVAAWIEAYPERWMAETCAGALGKLAGTDLADAPRNISIPAPDGSWVSLPRGFYHLYDDEHPVLEGVQISEVRVLAPSAALAQGDTRHTSVSPGVLEPRHAAGMPGRGR